MRLLRAWPIFFGLIPIASTLQVTPNSPCSTLCMDSTNDNPNDPNSSNTNGTDITCNDPDFNTTFVGEKFQSCLNCLQNSAYTSGTESDQSWFLYNLRYAIDWCVFGYPSNDAPIGGPCSVGSACGALSTALETEILNPSESSTYDYCSADSGAFQDQNVLQCSSCLMGLSSNSYLSNFLVALNAGCQQQPTGGLVIGLNDTVFTSTQVAITTASLPTSTSGASTGSSGLSLNAKIGIIVTGLIVLLIIIGVSVILCKKRQRRKVLASRRNTRFSAFETNVVTAGGKSSSSVSSEYSLKNLSHPPSSPYTGGVTSVQQGHNQYSKQESQNFLSSEDPSPTNSAHIPPRTYSNSSPGIAATTPTYSPIHTRNFSNPTRVTIQHSPASVSTRSPLAEIPPYNPSTYIP